MLDVRRRHEQRRTNLGVMPMSPVGHGVNPEAVRDQHDRPLGPLDRVVQRGDPVVQVRPFPVPLLDPDSVGPVPRPVGLPVITPGPAQPRHNDHVHHGGDSTPVRPDCTGVRAEYGQYRVSDDSYADAVLSAVSMVPISDLVRGDSPRLDGENEEHVQRLAETDEPLPPILVHRPSMLVIDGMHRLRAARIRGQSTIAVQFLDCAPDEIFVEMVRANVAHGLPLSLADRKAAAGRVLTTHPHWSDRMIAAVTGLSHKTVGRIRRDLAGHLPEAASRVGRDGHARPLDPGGRERAEEIVRRDPDASLRAVARAAGVSVGTVHAVRREVNSHRAAVPVSDISEGQWAAMMQRLRADPSLRFTEAGRAVLHLFGSHSIAGGGWRRLSDSVPAHWAPSLAGLAHELAVAWQQFAAHLDEVARDSGERLPGQRREPPAT